MIKHNQWVLTTDDIIYTSYYVMIGEMYVSFYDGNEGDIGFTKKKSRAKDFFEQEDGTIHWMKELMTAYPQAELYAVRESRVTEETKAVYLG